LPVCSSAAFRKSLARLDRARIIDAASNLKTRGETPLVLSTLETIGDLEAAKGGTVILITDSEESCKGDLKAPAAILKGSGLDVTLNVVGFTLTGAAVKGQLTTLASSTCEPGRELPNGDYRIRVTAPGGVLEDKLTIAPNRLTTVSFAYESDKLAIRH
jgi:hypothetical protein